MVRFRWAPQNHQRRPDIDEVLQDQAWGPFLDDLPRQKRVRFDGELEDGEI